MFTNKTPTDKKGCIKRGLQDGNCLPTSRFREKWHTTREASCRRAFDPCAPILFVLYHYFEQNLHFGLVPAPPQVLSAQSILVAGFDTCNIPNRHISSRSKKFCTGVAKKWRFPERKWHQFKKQIRVRERHFLLRNVTKVTRHILSQKIVTKMTSLTQIWDGKLGRNSAKTDPKKVKRFLRPTLKNHFFVSFLHIEVYFFRVGLND